jgi:predicted lysophospholipase L1 biosynthesis ABC-type transport system permease subunit
MTLQDIKLAWQFYWQERSYSYTRFLRWTQAVLMIFIITLSSTSQSIQSYLTDNLANLLGADLVLAPTKALDDSDYNSLVQMSESVVLTQDVVTTLTHSDKWQRTKLKIVANDYPLQGELKAKKTIEGSGTALSSGPKPGEIWLDSRLIASLSIELGETLFIGSHPLLVSHVLLHEPDRLMEGHNVDMRAMVNRSDLPLLNIALDSISHRYLVSATSQQVERILDWQQAQLPAASINHKNGSHPLALFWQRTENVIGLASIILFFMAAIAIEQLTRVQTKKEQFFTAICLSLGASKAKSMQISILKWTIAMIISLPLMLLASALIHWAVIAWLANTFENLKWQWSILPGITAFFAVAGLFLIFQIPVWLALKTSTVARLVNNQEAKQGYWLSSVCAILVLTFIAFAYSDNGLLTAMVLGAMGISVALLVLTSWAGLTFSEKLSKPFSGLMPFALYMMKQRILSKSTQILGVGLCAFLLLFTLMLMKDLGDTMSAYQRQHNGNLMVSQATNVQMQDLRQWTKQQGGQVRQVKPFVYAKLTQINGLRVSEFTDTPSESLATFQREIRLHWTNSVPNNNRVIKGQWWATDSQQWQQISVEQEVLTDLGLSIGDKLTFHINAQPYEFSIVASHAYKSGGGSITFWVQMPLSAIDHINAEHYQMATVEIPEAVFPKLSELWQRHPSLRMVSLKELTARFDKTLAMVTQVISGFSLLIILLASIVMAASIQAQEAKEKKKNSIIMSFGLDRATCLKLNLIEWIVTGAIAATGAIVGTYVAGLLIYESQFSLTYQPDFLWLALTLSLILLCVTAFGAAASRKSLNSSVRELLAD